MQFWEYKTLYLNQVKFNDKGWPETDYIQWLLNMQGAKGWEIINFGLDEKTEKRNQSFWFLMRRPIKSCIEPYLNSGYSERQLDNIFSALRPYDGQEPKISIEKLNLFLDENGYDWNEDMLLDYISRCNFYEKYDFQL